MRQRTARAVHGNHLRPERESDRECCWPGCMRGLHPSIDGPLCPVHLVAASKIAKHATETLTTLSRLRPGHQQPPPPVMDHDLATMTPKELLRLAYPPKPVHERHGVIYFIRFGDYIKIGWTARPEQRIKELPHDEVLHTTPGFLREERALHALFAHLRHQGEWFRPDAELMSFIEHLRVKDAA